MNIARFHVPYCPPCGFSDWPVKFYGPDAPELIARLRCQKCGQSMTAMPGEMAHPAGGDALSDRYLALYILHFKPTQAEVIPHYANLLRQDGVRWGELNAAIVSRWSLSGLKRIKREAWRTLQ